MAEGDAKTSGPGEAVRFGRGFLRDIWYFAALGADLKPGKLQRYEILGEPVLIARPRAADQHRLAQDLVALQFARLQVCPERGEIPDIAQKAAAEAHGLAGSAGLGVAFGHAPSY